MDANVTANCVHPGIVRTRLTRDRDGLITDFVFFLTSKLLKSVPQAAATTCCLATSPRLRNVCGKYFSDCNEARTSNPDRAILKLRDCGLLRSCWSLQLLLPIKATQADINIGTPMYVPQRQLLKEIYPGVARTKTLVYIIGDFPLFLEDPRQIFFIASGSHVISGLFGRAIR
ncbi:hypothetical protein YC2023_059785 [Brassica napus]